MPDISIVIVNYNVKHFVDQCLRSVFEAGQNLNMEVLVVDNDSIDGSVQHIAAHFPDVNLIANKDNLGFAKANNQAIRKAKGKYILLLNPDTIIEKETLRICFDYMEVNSDCGAVGVKMIDGNGEFLPESKRGFPTPFASLMRLSGISKIFPRSSFFNSYNLGHLPENDINEVDVLCGAFMFIRSAALDEVGLLDEQFFMYGEDIDLSYRIQKGGYKIVYNPESTIVHFKGESTRKSSLRYYSTFYKAMAIFARKHFGGKAINPFLWLVNLAIVLIGISDYIKKSFSALILPIIEFLVFLGSLNLIQFFWAKFYYHDPDYYHDFSRIPVYIAYSFLWVISLWIAGSYRLSHNVKRQLWGLVGGSAAILILYALLDNSLRHSRAIILLAMLSTFILSLLIRHFYRLVNRASLHTKSIENRVIVVGNNMAYDRAKEILNSDRGKNKLVGAIFPGDESDMDINYLQALDKLEKVVEVYKIDEILFASDSVDLSEIMKWMTRLGSNVKIKILSKDVQSIIGSHDRNSRGDLYTVELKYAIQLGYNRMLKTIVDYLVLLLMLIISPVICLFNLNLKLIGILFTILIRRRTWVSYISHDRSLHSLPGLLPGVLNPVKLSDNNALNQEEVHRINFYYAKDYTVLKDIEIILLQLGSILRSRF